MLKLAALFGDNAVLQRDRAVPVWGWCAPFRRVRATLGDGSAETRSGAGPGNSCSASRRCRPPSA